MAENTKIEWVSSQGKNERTWNPVVGCTKISEGCKNCYALSMIKRFAGMKGWPNSQYGKPFLHYYRLEDPYKWKKPSVVFVCSMSDLFHRDVPDSFIKNMYDTMIKNKQHTFIVLTKRPERMGSFLWWIRTYYETEGFENIWHGVTVENKKHIGRIDLLRDMDVPGKFVSFEPLLESDEFKVEMRGIDLAIIGGESGAGARPMGWRALYGLMDQSHKSGSKIFVKQLGTAWAREHGFKSSKGSDMFEWQDWCRERNLPW